MAESKTPGISAAVVQDGEFVWSAGFGMADLENSVPAMSLWEHGKLDLDSTVQKYCPVVPQKKYAAHECTHSGRHAADASG